MSCVTLWGFSCVPSQGGGGGRQGARHPSREIGGIEIGVKPESLLHFHSSAQGKIALAFGSDQSRAAAIGPDLERMTPQTMLSVGVAEGNPAGADARLGR